ncbi:MAG: toprim domain-containing protein, partial [Oscillospiraceae bacterium]
FFRNRLMFPIIDVRGQVVGFSGRALGEDSRKYVNTSDTPIYKKSRTIYALNIAKSNDSRSIILCEGQMDVIALHRAGFSNAVAACGTALTEEQARMISQYADEVVLAYDSDEAGQKAARRSIEIFKKTDLNVKVLQYDDAKDPDELIVKFGPERLAQLISDAGNATEYELLRARKKYEIDTDSGRVQYLKEAAQILARAPTPTERDLYAGRVASYLDVGKSAILQQTEQIRRSAAAKNKKRADSDFARTGGGRFDPRAIDREHLGEASAQRRLIALIFTAPDLCGRISGRVTAADFISEDEKAIFS